MSRRLRTITPIDGSVYVERPLAERAEIAAAVETARSAAAEWRRVPLAERAALLARGVDAFVARRDEIALEITLADGPAACATRPARCAASRSARVT